MDTVGNPQPEARSGGQPARAGQSGEGARSALEQLLRDEMKRESQRPREGGGASGETADAAP